MRLRVFLFKRAIHTIITLLIVLVLLFIIFRLMPGDPTRFFIEPGQTEETRNQLLVKFGFRHWVDAPGEYREFSFEGTQPGCYPIVINVTDEDANSITLFASYNVGLDYHPGDPLRVYVQADPLLIHEDDSGSGDFFNEPLSRFSTADIGQDIIINASVDSSLTSISVTADVVHFDILTGDRTDFAMSVPFTQLGAIYSSNVLAPNESGFYEVDVIAHDSVENVTTIVPYVIAVNVPDSQMAPFHLIEDEGKLFTYEDEFTGGGRVSIAIESDVAKIPEGMNIVQATVVLPDGSIKGSINGGEGGDMIHPEVTAERNIFEQFWVYFTSMLQLDFGKSFYSQRPVWTEIQEKAPPTILLFGTSLILQAVFGVLIGVLLAWRRGTRMELSAVVIALFFYSMPLFWFGIILIWAFAFQLGWFPFGGMVTPELWAEGTPDLWTQITDIGTHMILPLITLMMVGLAFTILLMRNSMLEVLGEDYITTAKAKGLSERAVMYKHAARNAMLPVVTVIAISVGGVVSGGVLTETIFSWPGMGYYLVMSTLQQDYPAVQGVFFLLAVLTILANVAADVLYAFMDPRVRL